MDHSSTPATDATRLLPCSGSSSAARHDVRRRPGDPPAEVGPGDRVAAAKVLQKLADDVLRAAVVAERQAGTPWELIGKALGTSRSGAHGRFAEDVNGWRRDHPRTAHHDAQEQLDASWSDVEDLARQQLYLDPDRLADAEQFLRQSVADGSAHAVTGLAELLTHTGRAEEAEDCLRAAVDTGDPYAVVALSQLLHRTGRSVEAERLLRRADLEGNRHALVALAQLFAETDRGTEAELVLRRAADCGDSRATTALARLLLEDDRSDEAEQFLRLASADGDRRWPAYPMLIAYLAEGDMRGGADRWDHHALDAMWGDTTAQMKRTPSTRLGLVAALTQLHMTHTSRFGPDHDRLGAIERRLAKLEADDARHDRNREDGNASNEPEDGSSSAEVMPPRAAGRGGPPRLGGPGAAG